ncbi:MAG: tocopherol cyclase family protein [Lachnotalea sp.]
MNKHKHPEIFQKKNYNKAYFEGWYYKQVTADGKNTVSFIPGVNFDKSGAKSFIQCLYLNQNNGLNAYTIHYPIGAFSTKDNTFSISIKNSMFSMDSIKLDINSEKLKVKGNVKLMNLTPIETSALNPNIMGFFSYVPFMECKHGLISMSHQLSGTLNVNGEEIDFTGGKGYIEKDWGRSFPNSYVWIQSNHFEDRTTGLFCSVATIPFLSFSFTGFICNLIHQGKEYRFATYNGSKLIINERTDKIVNLELRNKRYHLEIKGEAVLFKKLLAPKMGTMDKTIKEGLSGKVEILLKDKKGHTILKSKSYQCGMELVDRL